MVYAGATISGSESSIVIVHGGKIDIFRRGPLTAEQLSELGTIDIVKSRDEVSAPGQLTMHYAPKTRLRLIEDANSFSPDKNQRVGLLAWNPGKSEKPFAVVRCLSERQDLREAATNLFRYLRALDAHDLDLIIAEQVPDRGLGAAIMDRLRRAAHHPLDGRGRPE